MRWQQSCTGLRGCQNKATIWQQGLQGLPRVEGQGLKHQRQQQQQQQQQLQALLLHQLVAMGRPAAPSCTLWLSS
jgi:hypothetical protein